MIAQNLTGSILTTLAVNWPIVLTILLVTLLSSAIVGGYWCAIAHYREILVPGFFSAARRQWSLWRKITAQIFARWRLCNICECCSSQAAVLVTRMMLGDNAEAVNQQIVWFPPVSINLLLTILLAVVAGTAGCLLRLPSGTMLIPMLAGAVLQSGQLITIELPEWLLAMAYMAIGWRIGLGFDKQILLRALRPLPQILLSIFALLAICAGMAWGLTRFMHIDFMTAYLATSPGGLDTVAVIAAGSNADMALIMAMQTLRLFSILLTGPAIARFISTYAPKRTA